MAFAGCIWMWSIDPVRESLAGNSARPRVTRLKEGALVVLRSVNFDTDESPDELIVLRIDITGRLIIITRRQPIQAMEEVLDDLHKNQGQNDSGSWLVAMSDALTDHTSEYIEDLHDKIIAIT